MNIHVIDKKLDRLLVLLDREHLNWLTVEEYATYYKCSNSTVYRRIRNNDVEARKNGGGKWLIKMAA